VPRRSVPARGQRSGRGAYLTFASTRSSNYEEVSKEWQRRCRGPHLWLWQRLRRRLGKYLWISMPFYLFYRWSLR
jgi:hypothetical protein